MVWLTADVHYAAAHHYDPNPAAFQHFDPFWEFMSGPLNAGAFPLDAVDSTFGPQQLFWLKAPGSERLTRHRVPVLRSGAHRP